MMGILHHEFKIPCGIFGLFLVLPLASPLIADPVSQSKITQFCHLYNQQDCLKTENGTCGGRVECDGALLRDKAACMVTWSNTSDKVVVLMKDCIYYDPSCQDQCIAHDPLDRTGSKPFYCCCRGDYCNSDFWWDPKEAEDTGHPPPIKITDATIAIYYTLGAFVCILLLGPLVFYLYRKKKLAHFIGLPNAESAALTNSPPSPVVNGRPIHLVEIKASGRFAKVWKAQYHSVYVAVKQFPEQEFSSWNTEKEIYSLSQMAHSNILQFIGVEKRVENLVTEYWLITAYHEQGSLYDYLKGNVLTWPQLCRIALSMARGLAYLHSEQPAVGANQLKPSIAHRDFKSKNVLLKADLTACIADFGLAITFFPGHMLGDTHGQFEQVGTRRYMAPEVLEGSIYFHKDAFLPIDMYACGLVMWELVTRCAADQEGIVREYRQPFEDQVGQLPTLDDMQECVVTRKKRPTINPSWFNQPGFSAIMQMMQECWDHDAEARLTAPCIVERCSMLPRENYSAPQGY